MKKHHWRQQVKSLFEGHVDQDKREQLKKTRKDMEDRKEKIIRLVKGGEQDETNGTSESLQELVKDYHKEYESLYELYHNLTAELKKKVNGRDEEDKEKFSSSSSDSDSEDKDSSKRKGGKNGEFQNDLDQERLQLIGENDELKAKLESSANMEIELNQTVEELAREKSILIEEKDNAIRCAEEAEAKLLELKDNVNKLEKEAEMVRGQKRELEEQLIKQNSEASEQMKEVFDQLNSFQKELMTLATIKAEMETELERKSQEVSESRTELHNLSEKVANSEADQKRILEEKISLESELDSLNDEVSKVTTENAELRSKVIDLEMNLRSAERKAEELSIGNESNDQLIIELQTTIEDLKRDMEMDKDEMMTTEEKNRNLEVMLRLSNQKLRVTEQLLVEKEASHNLLEEKTVALSQTLESYTDMIREISDQANASLASLESEIRNKFDEDCGGLAKRLCMLCDEARGLKSSVRETRLENEMVKKRIEKLVMEAEKERAGKEEIVKKLNEMNMDVKEKEERLMGLGDEKIEAIKQLCVWIEYYRSRCMELQGMLLKVAPKLRRTR